MKILHVIANPKPLVEAHSKQLSEIFVKLLTSSKKRPEIITVDLNESPPPFYTYDHYRYFWYPVFDVSFEASAEEKKSVDYALKQIKLFNEADVLVITAPMWNFSVPGILKAWMDQVLAPNGVFQMSAQGVKPLHHIKKIIVFTSSGGAYQQGDPKEHMIAQIKAAFGFVKIDKVEFAWAEGQNTFFYKDYKERMDSAKIKAKEISESLLNN